MRDLACTTYKIARLTETAPILSSVPEFAATERPTTPAPDPEAPETIVIHGSVVKGDHAQPAVAMTLNVTLPPLAGTLTSGLDIEKKQSRISWLIVNIWPATLMEPVRASP